MFSERNLIILALLVANSYNVADAFVSRTSPVFSQRSSSCSSCLFMGKGLNKARNKQAALAAKLAQAKAQKQGDSSSGNDDKMEEKLSDAEIKKRNDRKRFEELLKRESAMTMDEYSSDGYLSKSQEEAEISAVQSGKDWLFEGDPAPTVCFEELVSTKYNHAIGNSGAARLVPWLGKTRPNDYLIILTDPRSKSPELRETIKTLSASMPADLLDKMIVVNADSPAENRRWMKKNDAHKIEMYSDEKLGWMRSYTALGDERWSMSLFVIANERIEKLAREVDGIQAGRVVRNMIKSLK